MSGGSSGRPDDGPDGRSNDGSSDRLIDRWLVLTVVGAGPDEDGAVSDLLIEMGGMAVEERDGALITHLPSKADPEAVVRRLESRLERLADAAPRDAIRPEIRWRWQAHEDWSETWKRGLEPRRVGQRILVTPTWEEASAGPDDLVIRIDPGVAFGTAGHGSTRGCLQLLEGAVRAGDHLLDVGAGTGILSIASVLLGAAHVVAVEEDVYACEAARENVDLNGVAAEIDVMEGHVDETGPPVGEGFDGVVANIQTGILLSLQSRLEAALDPSGWLVLGGIPVEERAEIVTAFSGGSRHLGAEVSDEGWWSGAFTPVG